MVGTRNEPAAVRVARECRNFLARLNGSDVASSTGGKSDRLGREDAWGFACIIEERKPIGRLTAAHHAQRLLTNPIAAPTQRRQRGKSSRIRSSESAVN